MKINEKYALNEDGIIKIYDYFKKSKEFNNLTRVDLCYLLKLGQGSIAIYEREDGFTKDFTTLLKYCSLFNINEEQALFFYKNHYLIK